MTHPILDHVVVNVMGNLDGALQQYRRLGFQLSERGHHTLGSSNHLAIFGENYLELLGFEPGRQTQRADLWTHPVGLTGLVFKTSDALRLHGDLDTQGLAVDNPSDFSRPVRLADGLHDAAFRVVRLGSSLVPNGRVFFCQHFTPDLVWRDEWRQHQNGVVDIVEFVIAASDPQKTGDLYRTIFGSQALTDIKGGVAMKAGRATVLFLTPQDAESRFPGAVPTSTDGSDRMVALTFKARSVGSVADLLAKNAVPHTRDADRVVVPHDAAGGVALAFVE
ncbi:VOC family protein [Microvirga antarctica]|uniref:VOC family protein n=1 Tax=Microvirga antarctica TaxID=2819233 RepID=UPI0031BB5F18